MVSYGCGQRTVHMYVHMHAKAKCYSLHQVAFESFFEISFV